MQLFLTLPFAFVLVLATSINIDRTHASNADYEELFTSELFFDDEYVCIKVKNSKRGNKSNVVIIPDSTECTTWSFAKDGMIHLRDDKNYCLQAGHNVRGLDAIEDGTKMRIYACDPDSPAQQFVLKGVTERTQVGSIAMKVDRDLHVVFEGVTADPGEDAIILKNKDTLDRKRRKGWLFD